MSSAPRAGVHLHDALDQHPSLAGLMQRVQASRESLAAIIDLLPPALCNEVQAGPLDDTGWTLLARHASAAAKLRQLLPAFEARLRERRPPGTPIRIKILAPR
jgi:hypothetical protein